MSLIWFCVHDGLDGWMAGWLDEQPHPAQVIVDVRWIY